MPCGKTHAKFSLMLAPVVAVATLAITRDPMYAVASGLGCLAGIPLTPDLDQEGISSSEYWIIKWTLGLGFLWTMIWFPYALLCPHRSFISHFPIISTFLRLLYLSVLAALICYFCSLRIPAFDYLIAIWAVFGLVVSDSVHWALDVKFGDPFRHDSNRGKLEIRRA